MLKEIEDYNRYDCRSTRELRDWLMAARLSNPACTPLGAQPVRRRQAPSKTDDALAATLAEFAGDARRRRTPEQTAVAMVAAARGYHRREDKPFWWAHFDRLNYPVDEWADNTDVFVAERRRRSSPTGTSRRGRASRSGGVRLPGELARGDLKQRRVRALRAAGAAGHDRRSGPAGGRAASTVVECDDPAAPTEVVICERAAASDGRRFDQLPFALTPGPPIRRPSRCGSPSSRPRPTWPPACRNCPARAVIDVLLRRRAPHPQRRRASPRRRHRRRHHRGAAGPGLVVPGGARAAGHRQDVHRRPGHRTLVTEHGWRIGVVAQSHAVVENLLRLCDRRRRGSGSGSPRSTTTAGRRAGRRSTSSDYAALHRRHAGLRDRRHGMGFRQRQSGAAGQPGSAGDRRGRASSAWPTPSRWRRPPRTCCCSATRSSCRRSARALTPSRSTPRRWAGCSTVSARCPPSAATSWTARTGCTRRCAPRCRRCPTRAGCIPTTSAPPRAASTGISPACGCLRSTTKATRPTAPRRPTRSSPRSTGCSAPSWTDEHGTRPLAAADVLVLAPYNAQVALLRRALAAAGLDAVRVGTVDKFQGAAGAGGLHLDDGLVHRRGAARNLVPAQQESAQRRGQPGAVRGGDRALAVLTEYLPATPAGLVDLGAFLALHVSPVCR